MVRASRVAVPLLVVALVCSAGCASGADSCERIADADAAQGTATIPGSSETTGRVEETSPETEVLLVELALAGGEAREANQDLAEDLRPIPPIKTRRGPSDTAALGAREIKTVPDPTPPEPRELLIDDFEGGGPAWEPINWPNANPCTLEVVPVNGGHAMAIDCPEGDMAKAGMSMTAGGTDMSGFDRVALDIKLEDVEEGQVAVAFITGGFYESLFRELEPGWNRDVSFPLGSLTYKTGPNWEHRHPLPGLSQARTFFVVVYYRGRCRALVDNVRLLRERG